MVWMNGSYRAARSFHGTKAGRCQFWPRVLKASGRAPTVQSLASRSCQIHASAPPGWKPMGKSCIIGNTAAARANCPSTSHCSH